MERLTRRQQDIARLVARGYSTPQIARALGLSEQTVKNHLADTYAVMGWTNDAGNQRVLLARLMWEQGENARTNAGKWYNEQAGPALTPQVPALTPDSEHSGKER